MLTRRIKAAFAALCLTLILGCQPPLTEADLPPLPSVDLSGFAPVIAEQIEAAFSAVRNAPLDEGANGQLALVLATYDLSDAASVVYSRARLIDPDDYRWAYAHGHLAGWTGDTEAAIHILEPALAASPDNFWLGQELADQYLAAGRLDESQALFEQLTERFPERFQGYLGLGRVQLRQGDEPAAIRALLRADDIQPNIGETHFALGNAYRQTGDPGAAAEHFALASEYEENVADAYSPLMQEMASLDRGARPLVKRAQMLHKQRRFPEAIDALRSALEIEPARQDAHAHLVWLYGQLGQVVDAKRQYDEAVAVGAAESLLHFNMGVVLRRAGELDNAAAMFREAIRADAAMATAHAELGLVLLQQDNVDESLASFHRAVDIDPTHQNANFMLGRHYAGTGENDRALDYLQAAVQTETAATPIHLRTLAGIYSRLNQHQSAVEALTRAKVLLAQSGATTTARGSALKTAIDQDLDIARRAATLASAAAAEG